MNKMTVGEMVDWSNRYVEIINSESTDEIKDSRLSNLMEDLERAYQIPGLLANAKNVCPTALEFYRMVSKKRSF